MIREIYTKRAERERDRETQTNREMNRDTHIKKDREPEKGGDTGNRKN